MGERERKRERERQTDRGERRESSESRWETKAPFTVVRASALRKSSEGTEVSGHHPPFPRLNSLHWKQALQWAVDLSGNRRGTCLTLSLCAPWDLPVPSERTSPPARKHGIHSLICDGLLSSQPLKCTWHLCITTNNAELILHRYFSYFGPIT